MPTKTANTAVAKEPKANLPEIYLREASHLGVANKIVQRLRFRKPKTAGIGVWKNKEKSEFYNHD